MSAGLRWQFVLILMVFWRSFGAELLLPPSNSRRNSSSLGRHPVGWMNWPQSLANQRGVALHLPITWKRLWKWRKMKKSRLYVLRLGKIHLLRDTFLKSTSIVSSVQYLQQAVCGRSSQLEPLSYWLSITSRSDGMGTWLSVPFIPYPIRAPSRCSVPPLGGTVSVKTLTVPLKKSSFALWCYNWTFNPPQSFFTV